VAVQLDDADPAPVGPLFEDTMFRRRLPGEGAFDLTGLVQSLDRVGVTGPYSVEIMSTEEQRRPVREAAARAYEATRAVLTEARRARPDEQDARWERPTLRPFNRGVNGSPTG
jgi:sugar phosphate isomerase/epimerase